MMKSGTTSLYYSLFNHPRVERSKIKETNFYTNSYYYDGIRSYITNFSPEPSQYMLDSSPKYMMRPESAKLIYSVNPYAKFIVMMRDPVDRAYSHYYYIRRLFESGTLDNSPKMINCPERVNITFAQYLKEEYAVLQHCKMMRKVPEPDWMKETEDMPEECKSWTCAHKSNNPCEDCFPITDVHLSSQKYSGHIFYSLYASKIRYYLSYFPRENFLFVRFEDILEKGEAYVMSNIADWLGLEQIPDEQWTQEVNQNAIEHDPLPEHIEQFLIEVFRDPNQELYELLGQDYNWKS